MSQRPPTPRPTSPQPAAQPPAMPNVNYQAQIDAMNKQLETMRTMGAGSNNPSWAGGIDAINRQIDNLIRLESEQSQRAAQAKAASYRLAGSAAQTGSTGTTTGTGGTGGYGQSAGTANLPTAQQYNQPAPLPAMPWEGGSGGASQFNQWSAPAVNLADLLPQFMAQIQPRITDEMLTGERERQRSRAEGDARRTAGGMVRGMGGTSSPGAQAAIANAFMRARSTPEQQYQQSLVNRVYNEQDLEKSRREGLLGLTNADTQRSLGYGRLANDQELGRGELSLKGYLGQGGLARDFADLGLRRDLGFSELDLKKDLAGKELAFEYEKLAANDPTADDWHKRAQLQLQRDQLGLEREGMQSSNQLNLLKTVSSQGYSGGNPLALKVQGLLGGGGAANASLRGATGNTALAATTNATANNANRVLGGGLASNALARLF